MRRQNLQGVAGWEVHLPHPGGFASSYSDSQCWWRQYHSSELLLHLQHDVARDLLTGLPALQHTVAYTVSHTGAVVWVFDSRLV